jgi:hypothetical protein
MASFSPNPFRPGAGRVPPELAGRSAILDSFTRLIDQVAATGEGDRPWVLSGLRGVGKTVLLNELVRRARERDWITIKIEASANQPLAAVISREFHLALRRETRAAERAGELVKRAWSALGNFQLQFDPDGSVRVRATLNRPADPGIADSGDLAIDLQELLRSLAEIAGALQVGVLLAIDELQEAPVEDLGALNIALHDLGQEATPPPIVFIGTGLPSLPAVLADATSYAERLYDFRSIGLLDPEATAFALTSPAGHLDVVWDERALNRVVQTTGGYPYFVQACGKHVWDSRVGEVISESDAVLGIARARDEVDQGLYRSRLDRVTPVQRSFLRAMAADRDRPSSTSELVERMGKKRPADLSVPRRELIRAGHIYVPDRGYVAFTVPGMADYLDRHPD